MLTIVIIALFVIATTSGCTSSDNSSANENEEIPLIDIVGHTKLIHKKSGRESDGNINDTIEKNDLVSFDISGIREEIFTNYSLPVIIDGINDRMILKELIVNDVGVNTETHSYRGHLESTENSEIVLTVSENSFLASIIINGSEYCIESTSSKDPSGNYHHREYRLSDLKIEGEYLPFIQDYLAHAEPYNETEIISE